MEVDGDANLKPLSENGNDVAGKSSTNQERLSPHGKTMAQPSGSKAPNPHSSKSVASQGTHKSSKNGSPNGKSVKIKSSKPGTIMFYDFEMLPNQTIMKKQMKLYRCDICTATYRHCFSLKRHFLRNHVTIRYISKSDIANCKINVNQTNDEPNPSGPTVLTALPPEVTVKKRKRIQGSGSSGSESKGAMKDLFRCHLCSNVTFGKRSELRNHYERHPSSLKTRFPCEKCDAVFSHKQTLFRHLSSHEGTTNFPCITCGKSFESKNAYLKHAATHTDSRTCKYCSKILSTKANKMRHERIHEGLKPYPCKHCQSQFTQSGDLKKHLKRQHNALYLTCFLCSNLFSSKVSLKKHMLDKHEKHVVLSKEPSPQPPPVVKSGPSRFSHLRANSKATFVSLKEQTYNCTVCKKSCPSYISMLRHRRQNHPFLHVTRRMHRRQLNYTGSRLFRNGRATSYMTEKEFYKSVSNMIADNLLNHVDGKTAQLSLRQYNFSDQMDQCSVVPSQPWSSYNFPTNFDVDQALNVKGHEIKNRCNDYVPPNSDSPFTIEWKYKNSEYENGYEYHNYSESSSELSDLDEPNLFYDETDLTNVDIEERKKLIGREVKYVVVCSVCKEKFTDHIAFDNHSINNHPNVLCTCIEIEGSKHDPPTVPEDLRWQFLSPTGVYFSCIVPPPVSEKPCINCTKCNATFSSAPELHEHIIHCGDKGTTTMRHVRKLVPERKIKRTMKKRMNTTIKPHFSKIGLPINLSNASSSTNGSALQKILQHTNKMHLQMKRSLGRPKINLCISCPHCKQTFRTKSLLNSHVNRCYKRVVMNNSSSSIKRITTKKDAPKKVTTSSNKTPERSEKTVPPIQNCIVLKRTSTALGKHGEFCYEVSKLVSDRPKTKPAETASPPKIPPKTVSALHIAENADSPTTCTVGEKLSLKLTLKPQKSLSKSDDSFLTYEQVESNSILTKKISVKCKLGDISVDEIKPAKKLKSSDATTSFSKDGKKSKKSTHSSTDESNCSINKNLPSPSKSQELEAVPSATTSQATAEPSVSDNYNFVGTSKEKRKSSRILDGSCEKPYKIKKLDSPKKGKKKSHKANEDSIDLNNTSGNSVEIQTITPISVSISPKGIKLSITSSSESDAKSGQVKTDCAVPLEVSMDYNVESQVPSMGKKNMQKHLLNVTEGPLDPKNSLPISEDIQTETPVASTNISTELSATSLNDIATTSHQLKVHSTSLLGPSTKAMKDLEIHSGTKKKKQKCSLNSTEDSPNSKNSLLIPKEVSSSPANAKFSCNASPNDSTILSKQEKGDTVIPIQITKRRSCKVKRFGVVAVASTEGKKRGRPVQKSTGQKGTSVKNSSFRTKKIGAQATVSSASSKSSSEPYISSHNDLEDSNQKKTESSMLLVKLEKEKSDNCLPSSSGNSFSLKPSTSESETSQMDTPLPLSSSEQDSELLPSLQKPTVTNQKERQSISLKVSKKAKKLQKFIDAIKSKVKKGKKHLQKESTTVSEKAEEQISTPSLEFKISSLSNTDITHPQVQKGSPGISFELGDKPGVASCSSKMHKMTSQSRMESPRDRLSPSLEIIVNSIKEKLTSDELSPSQSTFSWMEDEPLDMSLMSKSLTSSPVKLESTPCIPRNLELVTSKDSLEVGKPEENNEHSISATSGDTATHRGIDDTQNSSFTSSKDSSLEESTLKAEGTENRMLPLEGPEDLSPQHKAISTESGNQSLLKTPNMSVVTDESVAAESFTHPEEQPSVKTDQSTSKTKLPKITRKKKKKVGKPFQLTFMCSNSQDIAITPEHLSSNLPGTSSPVLDSTEGAFSMLKGTNSILSQNVPNNEALDGDSPVDFTSDSPCLIKEEFPEGKSDSFKEYHKCPYCHLHFCYLNNYRRHLNICKDKDKKIIPEPPVAAPSCKLYLPKKDEIEASMLNLVRHQSRQSQMRKEANLSEPEESKRFQSYTCDSCHKIFLSLFKLLQHRVEHKLHTTDDNSVDSCQNISQESISLDGESLVDEDDDGALVESDRVSMDTANASVEEEVVKVEDESADAETASIERKNIIAENESKVPSDAASSVVLLEGGNASPELNEVDDKDELVLSSTSNLVASEEVRLSHVDDTIAFVSTRGVISKVPAEEPCIPMKTESVPDVADSKPVSREDTLLVTECKVDVNPVEINEDHIEASSLNSGDCNSESQDILNSVESSSSAESQIKVEDDNDTIVSTEESVPPSTLDLSFVSTQSTTSSSSALSKRTCSVCNKTFSSVNYIKIHMEKMHSVRKVVTKGKPLKKKLPPKPKIVKVKVEVAKKPVVKAKKKIVKTKRRAFKRQCKKISPKTVVKNKKPVVNKKKKLTK